MKLLMGGFLGLVLLACSSSTTGDGGGGCGDIAGNFTTTSTRLSGTCDPFEGESNPSTVTFVKDVDGAWNIVLQGVEGGCPGALDASTCQFVAVCKVTDKAGNTVATYSIDYTFAGKSFSGSSTGALAPAGKTCTVTYKDSGQKI